jgi:hypothetical protein
MDAAAREEFLAGVHVGVLSAAMGAPGRTLAVPVWYGYRPGGLVTVLTGRESRKARAIRAAGRFSLCAQDQRPPYRYVSVEGPVLSEMSPLLLSASRWPAATWASPMVTGTWRITLTPAARTWRSGCAPNTGLVKTRAPG